MITGKHEIARQSKPGRATRKGEEKRRRLDSYTAMFAQQCVGAQTISQNQCDCAE
jgi:hypothetical protein